MKALIVVLQCSGSFKCFLLVTQMKKTYFVCVCVRRYDYVFALTNQQLLVIYIHANHDQSDTFDLFIWLI